MSWRAAISAWTRKHVGCQREHERDESDLCASVGGWWRWWSGVDGGGGLTSRKRAQPTGRLVCSRKPSLKAGGGGEEALEPLRWRRSSLCCPLQGGMGLQRHGPGLGPGAALVVASREADLAQLPCPIARPASFGDEVHHAEGRLSSLACRDAARAVEICVGPLAPCSKREKGKGKGRLAILVGNLQSGCRPWVPGVSQRLGASPGNTLLRKSPRRPLSLHQRCPLSLPALPASLQDPDQYSNLSFSVGESTLSCLEQKRCLRGSLRPLLLTSPVRPVAETDRTLEHPAHWTTSSSLYPLFQEVQQRKTRKPQNALLQTYHNFSFSRRQNRLDRRPSPGSSPFTRLKRRRRVSAATPVTTPSTAVNRPSTAPRAIDSGLDRHRLIHPTPSTTPDPTTQVRVAHDQPCFTAVLRSQGLPSPELARETSPRPSCISRRLPALPVGNAHTRRLKTLSSHLQVHLASGCPHLLKIPLVSPPQPTAACMSPEPPAPRPTCCA